MMLQVNESLTGLEPKKGSILQHSENEISKIRDPEFSKRIISAADHDPHCPPLRAGRYVWVQDQLQKRYDLQVSEETIRKWFAGESRPRQPKGDYLAELLHVDPSWLLLGVDVSLTPRERRARNAMADGAVNVIAGLIRMDGGTPAFPKEDDKAVAEGTDLFAIIKGAQYPLHVSVAVVEDDKLYFALPSGYDQLVLLGMVRDGFNFQVYEIPGAVVEEKGNRQGGSIELVISNPDDELRRIDNFEDRL